MAIVKTYQYPHGTVHICDDAYKDASPEEIARRIRVMQRVAGEIMLHAEQRRRFAAAEQQEETK